MRNQHSEGAATRHVHECHGKGLEVGVCLHLQVDCRFQNSRVREISAGGVTELPRGMPCLGQAVTRRVVVFEMGWHLLLLHRVAVAVAVVVVPGHARAGLHLYGE